MAKKKAKKKASLMEMLERRRALLTAGIEDLPLGMPVDVAVLEALRCEESGKRLRKKLIAVPGFDARNLDDIPALVAELRAAQDAWLRTRVKSAEKSLTEARRKAEKLRTKMMASGRYLLRDDANAMAVLDQIAEGDGLADLVDDLRRLAGFVETHPAELKADTLMPKGAVAEARALAETLERGPGDPEAAIEAQARRNRGFAMLQRAVDEVRAAARYKFHDDPKRLAPFLSQYTAAKMRKNREKRREAAAAAGGDDE